MTVSAFHECFIMRRYLGPFFIYLFSFFLKQQNGSEAVTKEATAATVHAPEAGK